MPYDDPDPSDPMTLTGVELVIDEPGAVEEMAVCFIEEYVRLGLSAAAICELFESHQFAGPKLAMEQLGPTVIHRMIQEQLLLRGPRAMRTQLNQAPGGSLSLPVLDR